ncbi:hypothetical protein [Cryptosporangium minutisporangium]|uniref:hypothetical protein n=1 Tax=Cryptosporangium minutisporangium TaxID=113569 RepID=UPI0031E77654
MTAIRWADEQQYDVHLLRGTTRLLAESLILERDDGPPVSAQNLPAGLNVSVSFAARTVLDRPRHGVTIRAADGFLDADTNPPSGALVRNFMVVAGVIDQVSGKTFEQRIRVHLHTSVARMWLTPATLAIRSGADGSRFTVLARFDDGTIGDVTNWPNLIWTVTEPGAGTPSQAVRFAPDVGLQTLAVGREAQVSVAFPGPPRRTATATVRTEPAWSTPTQVTPLARRPGGDWRQRPNVLFLSEGFEADEAQEFLRVVRAVVKNLRTWPSARPYNLVGDFLNVWTCFRPSREAGVSFLSECYTTPRRNRTTGARLVTRPALPLTATSEWSVANLVDAVGLPVPVDDGPGTNTTLQQKLRDWERLYPGRVPADAVTPEVYADWRAQAGRILVNERDTAFGFGYGERPTFQDPDTEPFHRRRLREAPFLDFLGSLRFGTEPIGPTWTTGKDRRLVCLVLRSRFISGNAFGHHFSMALGSKQELLVRDAASGDGTDLVVPAVPRTVPLTAVGSAAHEFSHCVNLADEYGRAPGPPTVTEAAEVRRHGNVQLASDLGSTGNIDADRIIWTWHRIARCGVLATAPVPRGDNEYTLRLRPGDAFPFQVDDLVRLRGRPLTQRPDPSFALRVTARTGDELSAEQIEGLPTALDPALFPAGADPQLDSIVYAPVRAADGTTELTLVAPAIQRHLRTTRRPLYANPVAGCGFDASVVQKPTSLPSGLDPRRPRFRELLVGLSEGGAEFNCGVYHPTGACLMRDTRSLVEKLPHLAGFCPVCRYLLVDVLDPTRHGEVDAYYAPDYPRP